MGRSKGTLRSCAPGAWPLGDDGFLQCLACLQPTGLNLFLLHVNTLFIRQQLEQAGLALGLVEAGVGKVGLQGGAAGGELVELALQPVQALAQGLDPLAAINDGFVPGISYVGEQYGMGEMFLPELIQAAEVMKQVTEAITAALPKDQAGSQVKGTVVLGTVQGDIHDIGKDLVVFLLEVSGFDVVDLGIDVPPERFVRAVRESEPQVVGLSGFLTLAFGAMKETVDAIRDAGLRDRVRIMIGGGQIDDEIRRYTGADAYGTNAMEAVRLSRAWVEGR